MDENGAAYVNSLNQIVTDMVDANKQRNFNDGHKQELHWTRFANDSTEADQDCSGSKASIHKTHPVDLDGILFHITKRHKKINKEHAQKGLLFSKPYMNPLTKTAYSTDMTVNNKVKLTAE